MKIILLLMCLENPKNFEMLLDQSMLDRVGISTPIDGFVRGGQVYVGQQTLIVQFDLNSRPVSRFNSKGNGPQELKSGGPIFYLRDALWCYDIMGKKFAVFNKDLTVREKRHSLEEPTLFDGAFAPGVKNLFVIRLQVDTVPDFEVMEIDPESMKLVRKHVLSKWRSQGLRGTLPKMAQLSGNIFAIWETVQSSADFSVLIWNAETGKASVLKQLNPSRSAKGSCQFWHEWVMSGASLINRVNFSGHSYLVNLSTPLELNKPRKKIDEDFRDHLYQFNNKNQPVKTMMDSAMKIVRSNGETEKILLYSAEEGVFALTEGF